MSSEFEQPEAPETAAPGPTEQEQAEYARDVQKYGRDKADEIWARAASRAGVNADEFRTWQVRDLPSILVEEELTTKEKFSEFLASPQARLLDAELEKLLEGKPRTAANLTRATLKAISNVRNRPVKTAWEMTREEMDTAAERAREERRQEEVARRNQVHAKWAQRRQRYMEAPPEERPSWIGKHPLAMTPSEFADYQSKMRP